MDNNYCVYRHISPSGKVYIGITSVFPNKRWRKGHGYTHGVPTPFSKAIKKYGWENIKHEILLENRCKSEAIYAEKYLIRWYKMHNMSYNVLDGGEIGGSLVGEEHPMYGKHETHPMYGIKGADNPCSIKVYQYDRNGNFIKEWAGSSEAARHFSNEASAKTSITACCRYRIHTCNGYIWRYFYKERLDECAPTHEKQVFQYDIDGTFIKEYNRIIDVSKDLNIPKNRMCIISSCCRGNNISGLGFFWSYYKFDKYPIYNVRPEVITKMKKYREKQINKQTTKK